MTLEEEETEHRRDAVSRLLHWPSGVFRTSLLHQQCCQNHLHVNVDPRSQHYASVDIDQN